MKRALIILSVLTLFCAKASAQSAIVRDFRPSCDSLCVLLNERSGIDGKLRLKAIMKRGKTLDFYFTESLGDHPLREETRNGSEKLSSSFSRANGRDTA